MPVGTYGNIAVSKDGPPYKARARFRDADGVVRPVARFGQTKTAAKNALVEALRDRQRGVSDGLITPATPLAELADAYLATGGTDKPWSIGTRQTYTDTVRTAIKPTFGGIRIGELRLATINRGLSKINVASGPGAAKTAKTVLTGMCALAISNEALDSNPVRDAMRITKPVKDPIRALTIDEEQAILGSFHEQDLRGENYDLEDFTYFMLRTGARIGEVCAVRDEVLELTAATFDDAGALLVPASGIVEINATVIRVGGAKRLHALERKAERTWEEDEELHALRTLTPGLHIQRRPKTAAGWRRIALPPSAVTMLLRRGEVRRFQGPEGVIFSSVRANALRDKSNTTGRLRLALDHIECPKCDGRPRKRGQTSCDEKGPFTWVTSHVFRKTVATRLDEAGLSARVIADQLGHARPSITQDIYMGRQVVSALAAEALER